MKLNFSLLAASAVVVACAGDPFTPTTDNVAGNYQLLTFVTSTDTGSTNWTDAGATLQMSLVTNGVTTGHLFVPNGAGPGADIDADMGGLWTLFADSVFFDQAADTFIRQMAFHAQQRKLYADHTFGTVRVRIILVK